MSGAAKFIVATVGGGLLLGAAGGHLANPVMQQRGGGEPWRQMLEPDIGSSRSGIMVEAPPQDLSPHGGRYSYAPAFADEAIETWSDPYVEAEWLEYGEVWPEPPTIAKLDARWAADEARDAEVYGRPVEFAAPSAVGDTAARAEQAAGEARAAAKAAPTADLPPEPRIARGELPAIW